MSDWWIGLPPAEASVECGGARHCLRWERGQLRALDHDDIEGERALAALGGEPCACVDVLDAWARYAADERVLVVASRGPADRIPQRVWATPHDDEPQSGWFSYVPMSIELDGPDAPLLSLIALPGALADRLVATVAAGCSGAGRRTHAALYGRVLSALVEWLGRPDIELTLRLGDAPALTRDRDGAVHAELPFSWLVDVWARGLATVMGRFCLSASTTDGRSWELLMVTPDFGPPETLRISL